MNSGATQAFPPRILPELLDNAVTRWPERVAMDFQGRVWRYGDLGASVARAARGLQDAGLRQGVILGQLGGVVGAKDAGP